MESNTKKITVDIWSDIACPWCYVGERYFKAAREEFLKTNPSCTVQTNYHAYMIDSATKKNGEEYLAYNQRRWGGDGWTHSLRQAGKKIGCTFANWKIWPNTLMCHCLIAAANKVNKAEEVIDDIFQACYEDGENVSDKTTLNTIADKYSLKNWDTKEIQTEVWEDDETGKEKHGIDSVPSFTFSNGFRMGGAQGTKAFVDALYKCK